MKSESDIILYSFIEAVGTIMAALSSTPLPDIDVDGDVRRGLDIVGNSLQAAGNALETETTSVFADGGNAWAAIGNSVVLSALSGCFDEPVNRKALAAGNLIQAMGNSILVGKTIERGTRTIGQTDFLIGSLLQATGNVLQAAGAGQDRGTLITVGGWVQSTGAVLSFVSAVQEVGESERCERRNDLPESGSEMYFIPYIRSV